MLGMSKLKGQRPTEALTPLSLIYHVTPIPRDKSTDIACCKMTILLWSKGYDAVMH